MSSERHVNARLAGYDGPCFVLTDELNQAIDGLGDELMSSTVRQAARFIPGYVRLDQEPITTDGYVWWWSPRFRWPDGSEMVILLPWWRRATDPEGRGAQRSSALYTRGDVDEAMIREIMHKLIDCLPNRSLHDIYARQWLVAHAPTLRGSLGVMPV